MTSGLDKTYNPSDHEDEIYAKWEKSGFFNPDNLALPPTAESYTIVLPPPNITDKLHMGHAAMVAIEDLLIRFRRLQGYRALWLPGTDHAAIATQNVVEKKILREQGQTRHDLGRTKFLQEVGDFLQVTQGEILHQMRKLGGSLDWSRLAFTLDEPRQAAVRQMFKEMSDEGAIYRGERIVNWCPRCHSTLADDEVEYQEQVARLYTFRYETDFPIAISTTRPETKLGDTAVAVNPQDQRYAGYIGKEFKVNFSGQDLKLKIIADHNVDINFGTGALGVTPAHSLVDWQMAQSHHLPVIKVINEDGLILDNFGRLAGLPVASARDLIVADLKNRGLLEREEDLPHNLSVCYRCGTAIEPLLSRQWFISVDKKLDRLGGQSLKEKALTAATSGQIKFVPERFSKRYLDWMNNLHDWCISRQIWFGHQIPVWYRGKEVYVGTTPPSGADWIQDPDTLDTWFSSGMWTFSTLGWPDNFKNGLKIGDLKKFHPTQVLETGYEIITLWVSRMIMMSLFALDEIPFKIVYLHGMILDKAGKKMSKSKGNGVDPLEMIVQFGADATRLSILMGATPGNDVRFSPDKVEEKRNFINKLWNVSRFILTTTAEKFYDAPADRQPAAKTLADRWILSSLARTTTIVTQHLENFNFSLAAEELQEFTWNKLADWYLEVAKVEKDKEEILIYLLKNLLLLWHPFAPFVTEAIWSGFNSSLLMVGHWPQITTAEDETGKTSVGQEFKIIQDIITAIRNARSTNKIEPAKKLSAVIYAASRAKLVTSQIELIRQLRTGLDKVEIKVRGEKIAKTISAVVGEIEIFLLGAVDPVKEGARLDQESGRLDQLIASQKQKLANADFIGRAPAAIVAAERAKLSGYEAARIKLAKLKENL